LLTIPKAEFGAAHSRRRNLERLTAARRVKKRATDTFFEDKKQYKISSGKLFILQKVSLTLQNSLYNKKFRFLRKATKDAVFGNCAPLKRGDRNF